MRAFRKGTILAGIIAALVLITGCPQNISDNPEIAIAQEWSAVCGQIDAGVVTATALNNAGKLSAEEVLVMDRVNTVYVGVCGTNDPDTLDGIVYDVAVQLAVGELCPELKIGDDIVVTVATATVCAARQYLILQLEAS